MYAIRSYYDGGASASDIETNISKPVEDALNSIDKLKQISSVSRDNISVVTLEFEYGADFRITSYNVCYTKLLRGAGSVGCHQI